MAEPPAGHPSDPPGLPVAVVEEHVRRELPDLLQGPLVAELTSGGRSNLTYTLTDGHTRWVLRRPPLGHVLATAHDMAREHRVLAGLAPTAVPVPAPLLLAGPEVIGAPFYVMEFADGRVLRTREQLAALDGPVARVAAQDLVDVLVRLHAVVPAEAGLGDLGRPAGYLDRQLRTWQRQLAASHSRDLPDLDALAGRLEAAVPTTQRDTVVHGDYRLDNVVVDPTDGSVVAVLDWEMATLGDPLTDLASMVVWWSGVNGLDLPVAAAPGEVPGYPDGETLVAAYADGTGLDLADLSWYLGFAYFKIAAIFEGIHYRSQQGLTVGDGFDRLGAVVPDLVARGHDALGQG